MESKRALYKKANSEGGSTMHNEKRFATHDSVALKVPPTHRLNQRPVGGMTNYHIGPHQTN